MKNCNTHIYLIWSTHAKLHIIMQVIKSVVHDFMMASSCDKVMMNWSFCLNERKWMDMQVIKGVVHDCTMACDESDDELKFWFGQLSSNIVEEAYAHDG